ncbi:hypothetical protein ACRJ4B_49895 [Streptomyces sp. GTA36]
MNLCGLCGANKVSGYLCPGCALGTTERLDRMPRLYAGLAAFLQPGGRRPELGRSRPAEAPLSASEPVMNLRGPGGIVGILEDWRSAMQVDRGWGEPLVRGDIERRIVVAARALSINIEWISEGWEMAGPMAEEVRRLELDVIAIVNPRDPAERPQRLGPCPKVLDAVGTGCGAVLLRRPGQTLVQCSWCGASWLPSRWLALAQAQRDAQEAANTPQDAGELHPLAS